MGFLSRTCCCRFPAQPDSGCATCCGREYRALLTSLLSETDIEPKSPSGLRREPIHAQHFSKAACLRRLSLRDQRQMPMRALCLCQFSQKSNAERWLEDLHRFLCASTVLLVLRDLLRATDTLCLAAATTIKCKHQCGQFARSTPASELETKRTVPSIGFGTSAF